MPLILYSVELGIAVVPMMGKWASSRVDLGYTELFCIPEVHQCSSRFVTVCLGLSGVPSRKSRLLTCLIRKTGLLCMQCRGIEPHFPVRGMCHTISRVAAGTWGIFASYSGDGHSKLHFRCCGKLADLFHQRQGIFSHFESICGASNFLRAALLK